jgi:hypothetical protein
MATLTFAERSGVNGSQLASEIQTALSLTSLPAFAQVDKNFTVTHPNISAGNQSAIQTVITNHVADPLFGVSAATLDIFVVTINGAVPIVWTNMPLALTGTTGTRTKIPLAGVRFTRLTADVLVAGSTNAVLIAQVSLDGSAWTSGPQVSISSTGLKVSSLVVVPPQFQVDCFFRIAGSGGDGAADPQFGLVTVQFG